MKTPMHQIANVAAAVAASDVMALRNLGFAGLGHHCQMEVTYLWMDTRLVFIQDDIDGEVHLVLGHDIAMKDALMLMRSAWYLSDVTDAYGICVSGLPESIDVVASMLDSMRYKVKMSEGCLILK